MMTKDKAIEILKNHNLWRRNRDDINPYEMTNPTELGIAIDYVVELLEKLKPTKKPDDSWIASVIELEDGDLALELPPESLSEIGWVEGDTLKWKDLGNGSWSISKQVGWQNIPEQSEETKDFISSLSTISDFKDINRFELIDRHGRQYVNYNINPEESDYSVQDKGKTLKIFIKDIST